MPLTLLLHDLFPKDAGAFVALLLFAYLLLPLLPGVLFSALAVPVRRQHGVLGLAMLAVCFALALLALGSALAGLSFGGLVGIAVAAVVIHHRSAHVPRRRLAADVAAGMGGYVAGAAGSFLLGLPLLLS